MRPIQPPRATHWSALRTTVQSSMRHLRRALTSYVQRLSALPRRRVAFLAAVCLAVAAIAIGSLWAYVGRNSHAASNGGFIHFLDTLHGTGFNVDVGQDDRFAGVFTFVVPGGVQYRGGQAGDLQVNGDGTIGVHFSGSAEVISVAGGQTGLSAVTVHLNATVNLSQRRATAEITDSTNNQHYVMVTTVLGGQSDAVNAVNQAMIAQDWATLYPLTTFSDGQQMSEAQFAQAMGQQVQKIGAIMNIVVTSAPQMTTNAVGVTYFTVTEQITYTHNGVTQTRTVLSAFALDGGVWKLWFSKAQS